MVVWPARIWRKIEYLWGLIKILQEGHENREGEKTVLERRLEAFADKHWNLAVLAVFVLAPIFSVAALFFFAAVIVLPAALIMGWG
ncbi:MAG: hypothetical protein Q4C55_09250 [Eubacterium sp.]|nr:hypothetical protein [Eubacterium sp.]